MYRHVHNTVYDVAVSESACSAWLVFLLCLPQCNNDDTFSFYWLLVFILGFRRKRVKYALGELVVNVKCALGVNVKYAVRTTNR